MKIELEITWCSVLGHKWSNLSHVNNCIIKQCKRCNSTKTLIKGV